MVLAAIAIDVLMPRLPAITPPWSDRAAARAAAVERSEATLRESRALLTAVQEVETGQRSFLLTGDAAYLAS